MVPSTPVDARFDLSDPDLIADHLPLEEFAWLRRNQPVRWNPQPPEAGYGDGEIAEIVGHVALSVFTNYFNLVAGTDIDFPKAPALHVESATTN